MLDAIRRFLTRLQNLIVQDAPPWADNEFLYDKGEDADERHS